MLSNLYCYFHIRNVALLLLLLWLHTTTSSVYNVTPDDHYYPDATCHHCHNLQHYLLNTTKYFTSNTQLLFLPGLHHLHTELIIQNVHNISLIGSTTNGTTPNTVIQRNSSVGIVMTNITNLIVTNITVRSCLGNEYNNVTVLIKQCTNVQLRHVVIEESHDSYGIVGINILGDSHFSFVSSNRLDVIYNDTLVNIEYHSLIIDHYYLVNNDNCWIAFKFLQTAYKVKITLLDSVIQWKTNGSMILINFDNQGIGQSVVLIRSCQIASKAHEFQILVRENDYEILQGNLVKFEHCIFYKLTNNLIKILDGPDIYFNSCTFYNSANYKGHVIKKVSTTLIPVMTALIITNSSFLWDSVIIKQSLLLIHAGDLHLIGPIVFRNVISDDSIIELHRSNITLSNYIEFSSNNVKSIILHQSTEYFMMFASDNVTINVSHNSFTYFAMHKIPGRLEYKYAYCYFQYFSSSENVAVRENYSIIFKRNVEKLMNSTYNNLPITHCKWIPNSTFNSEIPLEVNKRYIKYISEVSVSNLLPQMNQKKNLCYCDTKMHYDFYKDMLDPIYPGQTMTLHVYADGPIIQGFKPYDTVVTVINDIDWLPPTACVITNTSELVQIANSYTCNALKYSISSNGNWCELFLRGSRDGTGKTDKYYIQLKQCPIGFVKLGGNCLCYPFLNKHGIKCNINDQTLIRPANVWILPIQHGDSYVYILSKQCPLNYCLPHSLHLNFSTPNSQCQFNRSGILCGHCQQGLSTVFSISHCQQCSNIYLFLIVPIAIAGLVLVLLLFILNLTVTDGTINAFIFYVNIISVNTPVFFPHVSSFTPSYTFISLANLDLGIQTCFYNGMDDYAKMWLQLAFPFYLIFIATSLIITSRYSITIQRLTARRALPVLATLFLLSYTKVLLVISRVMFSYSKIIHLPSRHTTIVWSVDANVPVFSVRFITLFMVCSVIFLILIPFNIILLFIRTLSRFTLITKFKPLLDAYQGPYKDKMYYWVGLQLILRIVFFTVSSLDRSINLIICIALFSLIEAVHSAFKPFKKDVKNYHEHRFNVNILILFVVAIFSQDSINMFAINTIIALAMAHFFMIVVYHIITYVPCKIFRNKLLHFSALVRWITKKQYTHPIQPLRLQSFANRIPEATNYTEYREPLIVQEYSRNASGKNMLYYAYLIAQLVFPRRNKRFFG